LDKFRKYVRNQIVQKEYVLQVMHWSSRCSRLW